MDKKREIRNDLKELQMLLVRKMKWNQQKQSDGNRRLIAFTKISTLNIASLVWDITA